MIKAIILDFDGVIVNTDPFHFNSWKKVLKHYDIQIKFTQKDYNLIKGFSRIFSLNKIIQLHDIQEIKPELKSKILQKKNDFFLQSIKYISKENLIPGVQEFIVNNKGIYKIGVASASANATFILDKIGIINLFDVIIDANITNKKKPNPEVYFKCCEKLDLSPKECVVFEDSLNGVFASKSGGFVTYGVGNAEIKDEVDFFITNFLDFKLNDINS